MSMVAFPPFTQLPLEFDIVIERDPDGLYIATVPALYGCRGEARSLDELMERAKEAILLRLEMEGPDPDDLTFVGVHRIRFEYLPTFCNKDDRFSGFVTIPS